jgi:DNA phosphorothioation-dependent restriction protein DptG
MSELLAKAFKKISEELPEDEQDLLAERLLRFLEEEEAQWDATLGSPANAEKLNKLVSKAREHFEGGRTEPLDLKKL